MTVYVEIVLLDNFCLDFFILCASALTLRLKASRLRLFGGAMVGAIGATLSVYISGVFACVVKAAVLVLMCVAVVGFGKKLFWYILATLAYTFVSGGCIVGLFHLFKVPYLNADGTFYQTNIPLFVYVAALFLVAFGGYALYKYGSDIKKIMPHVVKANLSFGGKTTSVRAFCDSGNTLVYEGAAVCFVVRKIGKFDEYFADCLLHGNVVCVPLCTVAGSTKVCAVPATLTVNGEQSRRVYLALPQSKCPSLYDIIIDG